jgi:polynucleotide 5'-hydroxyl-kinase GRC3/NOL9
LTRYPQAELYHLLSVLVKTMKSSDITFPREWERIHPESLKGTIMVIGESDTGKTTFACYLFLQLCRCHNRVAFLDCDVGQSTLGLPTTLNLSLSGSEPSAFPPVLSPVEGPDGEVFSYFVGATSPRGHMLPTVIGARKLQQKAQELGAEAIVVDTTGLVSRLAGGGALKQWKIELLEPSVLVGLERGAELEHILWPWRWDKRVRVHDLPVSEHVIEKTRAERITHREERFRSYFQTAHTLRVPFRDIVVFGIEMMAGGRLLAFQDDEGFAMALGVARAYGGKPRDGKGQELTASTPLSNLEGVRSIRFGSLKLDPTTGQELGK